MLLLHDRIHRGTGLLKDEYLICESSPVAENHSCCLRLGALERSRYAPSLRKRRRLKRGLARMIVDAFARLRHPPQTSPRRMIARSRLTRSGACPVQTL